MEIVNDAENRKKYNLKGRRKRTIAAKGWCDLFSFNLIFSKLK